MDKRVIFSFDGSESFLVEVRRPETYAQLFEFLKSSENCIARGKGLSYCCASAGNNITSIDLTKFTRILSFDEINGTIKTEPGIPVGELLSVIIRKGWYFPVLPGYPSITVGGCAAFNVHGKSQINTGVFSDYVKELTLYHPLYGELKCSDSENTDVFNLTMGGFGLTGVILDITLKLVPLTGNSVLQVKEICKNILHAVEIMQVKKNDYDSVYSWNNLNLRGKLFGQGIVYLERFDKKYSKNEYKHTTFSTDGRKRLQFGFLNRFTTLLMCYGYYYSGFISSHSEYINILQASFPINGKEIYYHLFGREGLREYQLIIPEKNFENFILELRKAIIQYKIPMTLGSLKLFKGTKRYLNFCRDGICLALDVPNNKRSVSFFSGLDDLTKKYNGIANLSKDSRLNGETLSGMYREYDLLKEDLFKFDPEKHFTSALRERIGI